MVKKKRGEGRGGRERERKKRGNDWITPNILLLECSKRFNKFKLLRGDHISCRRCSVSWGQCTYQMLLIAQQMLLFFFFLLKGTEKSFNKTCINRQSSDWGCPVIYALSFGFDLLMNVACHITGFSGIFSLTSLFAILSLLIRCRTSRWLRRKK